MSSPPRTRPSTVALTAIAIGVLVIGAVLVAIALGVVLAAPSVVISGILGWSVQTTVLALAVPMVFYTAFGGVQAVAWTDVKQMFVIVAGVVAAIVVLLMGYAALGHFNRVSISVAANKQNSDATSAARATRD